MFYKKSKRNTELQIEFINTEKNYYFTGNDMLFKVWNSGSEVNKKSFKEGIQSQFDSLSEPEDKGNNIYKKTVFGADGDIIGTQSVKISTETGYDINEENNKK